MKDAINEIIKELSHECRRRTISTSLLQRRSTLPNDSLRDGERGRSDRGIKESASGTDTITGDRSGPGQDESGKRELTSIMST